jgi:carbonic anhydrase
MGTGALPSRARPREHGILTDTNARKSVRLPQVVREATFGSHMHRLIEGALRFQAEIHGHRQVPGENGGQAPFAMFIACSDSRVVPEVLTQRAPGDIFVVRNAGNIIPSYGPVAGGVSASIEYAVAALGIEDVVVCGHSDCGAMKAILRENRLDKMPAVASWIKHAAAAKEIVDATLPGNADEHARLHALVHENVLCQIRNLQTHPIVAARLATGRLRLYGWVYNIENGSVDTYDAEAGRFVPLTLGRPVHATSRSRLSYSVLHG